MIEGIRQSLGLTVAPHESVYTAGVWGMDVSHWQREIDYKAAKNEGIQFVIAKACDGNGFLDPFFASNYEKATAEGLLFFAYIYIRPSYKVNSQIETFTNAIGTRQVAGYMFDIETRDGVNIQVCTDCVWAIAKFFDGLGTKKYNLIYSRAEWWKSNIKRSTNWSKLAGIATAHWGVSVNYVATPMDWNTWDVWQAGQVTNRFGVKGDVDFCVWEKDKYPGNATIIPNITAVVNYDGKDYNLVMEK
jgi:lysozyme